MQCFTKCDVDGYGAGSLDVVASDYYRYWLEIQVGPESLTIMIRRSGSNSYRRIIWTGREAHAMGASLCDGELAADILADWCDENMPTEARDHDFQPDVAARWLRRTVAELVA